MVGCCVIGREESNVVSCLTISIQELDDIVGAISNSHVIMDLREERKEGGGGRGGG